MVLGGLNSILFYLCTCDMICILYILSVQELQDSVSSLCWVVLLFLCGPGG